MRRWHPPRLAELGSDHVRVALGLLLVALPLALGGAHPEVIAVAALAAIALLGAWAWVSDQHHRPRMTLPLVAVTLALAATALQLVPLPLPLLALVAPGAHDVLTLSPERAWAPLSMDPPATARELLVLALYVAALIVGSAVFREQRNRRRLYAAVSIAGGAVALLGFFHALVGLDQPWGTFGRRGDWFTSTFVNPNHLAGFLGFTALCTLGLAITGRRRWRVVHLVNATLQGAGVLLTLSRGGTVAFIAALAFLGLVLGLNRTRRFKQVAWAQLALGGTLLLAAYLAYTPIVHELWTLGDEAGYAKTEIWRPVPAMLADFPLLGVGRGAFTAVYPKYRAAQVSATFTHLENEWLQTLVDFGPPLGVLLLLLLVTQVWRVLRRSPDGAASSAVAAGAVFLGLQNLGDFNLALPAVALPALLCLAKAAGEPPDEPRHRPRLWRLWRGAVILSPARVRFAAVGLAALAAAATWPAISFTLERDTARLERLLQDAAGAAEPLPAGVAPLLRRHPADYLLPLLIAEQLLRQPNGAKRALPWINRGLYLAPQFGPGHHLAGRALLALGARGQALLEYRLAAEQSPTSTRALLEEIARLTGGLDTVAALATRTLPTRQAQVELLLARKAPALALAALDADPPLDELALELARVRALLDLGDSAGALTAAGVLEARAPELFEPYLFQSAAHQLAGDFAAAEATLERGLRQTLRKAPLLRRLAELMLQDGRLADARRHARDLLDKAPDSRASAAAHALLADIAQRDRDLSTAIRELRYARDQDRQALHYRLRLAALYERLGDLRSARLELERARHELADTPAIAAALERLKRAETTASERQHRELLQELR